MDKGKGPLYQAAVKAEGRLGHDRHHDLADRSGAGAEPQCNGKCGASAGLTVRRLPVLPRKLALTHFYLMLTQADAEKALGFVIVENFFQPSHVYLKQSAEVLSFAELICPPQ